MQRLVGLVCAWLGLLGAALGQTDGRITYYHTDYLGSVRMTSDAQGRVLNGQDYLPFGEALTAGENDQPRFTGQWRDAETGLDYFGARYHGSAVGRFLSVDPIPLVSPRLMDPQQGNRYAYARNNPIRFIDPTGEAIEISGDPGRRQYALQQYKNMVGRQAGAYLYLNPVAAKLSSGEAVTKYYLGIYTNGPDGKGPTFEEINPVAGELGPLIRDTKVVVSRFVVKDTEAPDGNYGGLVRISTIDQGTPGFTTKNFGLLEIYVLAGDPGKLPKEYFSPQPKEDVTVFTREVLGHELGHARARMTGDPNSVKAALRLEDKVRKLYDPTAPTRVVH